MTAADPQPGEVWRMRVDLPLGERRAARWPAGIETRSYRPPDAQPLHDLLVGGYAHGGGSVPPFSEWRAATLGDPEWDAELCFLATDGDLLAGVALCWSSGFVKDLVVAEPWRRRGLGEALLRHALERFVLRGASTLELKVEATNTAAFRLYRRVGMRVVERLATS